MTTGIEYEQFDQQDPQSDAGGGGVRGGDVDLRRISEVPMELSVEIGRTQMTVGETLELRAGAVITLDRPAGEPVDLLVNGTPIARGEVVVVDEKFGLRVKEIVQGQDAARDRHPSVGPEPAGAQAGIGAGSVAAQAEGELAALDG